MKNSIYNKLLTLILTYIILYAALFIFLHFYIPDLGDVSVTIKPTDYNSELQQVTLSTTKQFDKYYLFIYEDSSDDTWMYFNTTTHDKSSEFLIDQFIPSFKNKYVLLEGNKTKNTFSFTMKPKYPINYMSNKESKFHLFYIVPYKIFPFPTFYYSKHLIFFIEPIM